MTPLSRRVRVASRHIEAHGICSFHLVPDDGEGLPPFEAGAHVDVEVKPGLVRQYSLYNDPIDSSAYKIAVLQERNSRGGSAAMHQDVGAGSILRISEPKNKFSLRTVSGCPLLLAGGIGVTPLLSMAQHLSRCGAEFEMHYSTRTRAKTAFFDHIRQSPFSRHVQFHFDDGPSEQSFSVERLFSSTKSADGRDLYICGPQPFIELIQTAADSSGWRSDRIHRELFAAVLPDIGADAEFRIQLSRSGRILTVPAGKTALEVLRDHNVEIEVSCEQGICGTCATRVISGNVVHRDMYLSADEKAAGSVFMPCCSRGEGVLVVDL